MVLYTYPFLFQLVSPSLAHAMPTEPSYRALDGYTSWYTCKYLLLLLWPYLYEMQFRFEKRGQVLQVKLLDRRDWCDMKPA